MKYQQRDTHSHLGVVARQTPPPSPAAEDEAGSDLGASPSPVPPGRGAPLHHHYPAPTRPSAILPGERAPILAWRRKPENPCEITVREIIVSPEADPELCASSCPTDALRAEAGKVVADPGLCLACLACMALCGPEAVRVVPEWRCPEETGGEPH